MDDDQVLAAMEEDDSWRLVRTLAQGPAGSTDLVVRDGHGPYVRKRMAAGLASEAAWRTAAASGDPHLPHVVTLYRLPDQLVVVYDYIEGRTLDQVVGQDGPLPLCRALALAADLCHAAASLHAAGVVHRDITPRNVVVAQDGAHLIDLGIARQHEDGRTHDTTTLGTVGFAAPEQFGFAQTDARSDVYSLGRVLAFMLTGDRPGAADPVEGLAAAGVPEGVASLVGRACAFEPSARFQGADQMAAALEGELRELGGLEGEGQLSTGATQPAVGLAPLGGPGSPEPPAPADVVPPLGLWHWLDSARLAPEVCRALGSRGTATTGRKLAAGLALALGAVVAAGFLSSAVRSYLASGSTNDATTLVAMVPTAIWWGLAPAAELAAFALGLDGYERGCSGRGRRLALALLEDLVAAFALVVVVALFSAIILSILGL